MSHTKTPAAKFWALTTAVFASSALAFIVLYPLIAAALRAESDALSQKGSRVTGTEALADYQIAAWLNPQNQSAYLGLAQAQIATGQPEAALSSLQRAGERRDARRVKIKTLLELSRYGEAADEARPFAGATNSENDLLLAGMAYTLAGRTTDIQALRPRLSSPEALQRFLRIQTGELQLATELYATGLLNSSSGLLVKLPESYQRNLMLANIRLAQGKAGQLDEAAKLASAAIAINPASIEARELLVKISNAQGKPEVASQQEAIIKRLQSGRL